MSLKKYEEECPGCLPAALNLHTGEVLPNDHPVMRAMLAVWAKLTRAEREAWHRFTCQNSRETKDMRIVAAINRRMQMRIDEEEKTRS